MESCPYLLDFFSICNVFIGNTCRRCNVSQHSIQDFLACLGKHSRNIADVILHLINGSLEIEIGNFFQRCPEIHTVQVGKVAEFLQGAIHDKKLHI